MINRASKEKFRITFYIITLVLFAMIAFTLTITIGKSGAKPLVLIPILVVISAFENELISGLVGAILGLVMDYGDNIAFGAGGLYLLVVGVCFSLLFTHFLKKNFLNTFFLTALATGVLLMFQFFFNFVIFQYDGISIVFYHHFLPSFFLTLLVTPIIFVLMLLINKIFGRKMSTNSVVAFKKIRK